MKACVFMKQKNVFRQKSSVMALNCWLFYFFKVALYWALLTVLALICDCLLLLHGAKC